MPFGKYIYLNMVTSLLHFVIIYTHDQSRQLYAQPLLGKLKTPTIPPEQKASFLCITLAFEWVLRMSSRVCTQIGPHVDCKHISEIK